MMRPIHDFRYTQLMALHPESSKIALRRTVGPVDGCIAFHTDGNYASHTAQLTLTDDSEYEGGRLCFVTGAEAELSVPARPAGTLTKHAREVFHGVTRLHRGVRCSLFVVDVSNGLGERDVHRLDAAAVAGIVASLPKAPDLADVIAAQVAILPAQLVVQYPNIGAGSFKKVYKATLTSGNGQQAVVAAMRVRTADVAAEAKVLLELGQHPRLVRQLGVCSGFQFRDGPADDTILVVEFAPRGDLHSVVLDMMDEEDTIPIPIKLVVLQQVTSGMEALTDQKLIHRDLALRNVLVFALDVNDVGVTSVKVSDFGLTVNSYTAGVKYVQGGPLPVRWLAVEALKRGRYSEKTDVWAWGVLAWELISNGEIPYNAIPTDEGVIQHVFGNSTLARPTEQPVPDWLWAIVAKCWNTSPKNRPTFAVLGIELGCAAAVGTECVVCTDAAATHAMVPCGHKIVCEEHAPAVLATGRCPICRAPVQSVMKIFEA